MRTNELISKEVLDAGANRIGKVADIDVDMVKGAVNNIIIKAGLTKKYIVSLDMIKKIGDKVILRIKGNELK